MCFKNISMKMLTNFANSPKSQWYSQTQFFLVYRIQRANSAIRKKFRKVTSNKGSESCWRWLHLQISSWSLKQPSEILDIGNTVSAFRLYLKDESPLYLKINIRVPHEMNNYQVKFFYPWYNFLDSPFNLKSLRT